MPLRIVHTLKRAELEKRLGALTLTLNLNLTLTLTQTLTLTLVVHSITHAVAHRTHTAVLGTRAVRLSRAGAVARFVCCRSAS
jgi:hypothetical protein